MVDIVTTLTIDASGVEAGSATYFRVMQAIGAARDRIINQAAALNASIQNQSAVMTTNSQKIETVRRNWERMVGSIDPAISAATRFGVEYRKAVITADDAVKRLGVDQQFANQVLRESIQLARQRAAAAGDVGQRLTLGMSAAGDLNAVASQQMLAGMASSGRETAAALEQAAAAAARLDTAMTMFTERVTPGQAQLDRLNAELAEYKTLLDAGRISSDQFAAAQSSVSTRMLLAQRAFGGASQNARLTNFEMANLGFQLNDIGVMLASGQSPFVLIMQQGMQMAQILAVSSVATQGLKATFVALGQGLMSFVTSPLNAMVVGLAAVAGGIAFIWSQWSEGSPAMEDSLKRHEESIRRLKEAWGDAGSAQQDYIDETARVAQFAVESSAVLLEKAFRDNLASVMEPLRDQLAISERALSIGGGEGRPFGVAFEALDDFLQSIDEGQHKVLEFRESILSALEANPDTPGLFKFVEMLMEITDWAAKAERALDAMQKPTQRMAEQESMAALGGFDEQTLLALERIAEVSQLQLDSLRAKSPEEQADIARRQERIRLMGAEITVAERFLRVELAGLEARTAAEHAIREAAQERTQGMVKSIADARLELELIGMTTRDATRLRVQYELMQAAIEAARSEGGIVDEKEIGKINQTADAIAGLAVEAEVAARQLEAMSKAMREAAEKDSMLALKEFQRESAAQLIEIQQMLDIDLGAIGAKSPQELGAIAALRARTQALQQGESAAVANAAAEAARARTIAEAEHSIAEATEDRIRSMQQSTAAQELNLSLIGATIGESTRLRTEYELIVAAEEAARKVGGIVSPEELAAIEAAADAAGRLAESIAAATMMDDILFERSMMALNEIDRAIAEALRSAGLDINTPVGQDLADQMRFNLELEKTKDILADMEGFAQDVFGGFLSDLRQGTSLIEALGNALNRLGDKLLDMALNEIFTGLFGSGQQTTMQRRGGIWGLLGSLLSPQAPMGGGLALGGGVSGGLGVSAAWAAQHVGMGAAAGSVQQQVWNFFAAKGLQPHQIAGIMGNVGAESNFNPLAVGDAGNAFGLFQWNDRRNKMFDFIGGKQNLGDVNKQLEFAWHELMTSERGAMGRLRSSVDVRGATNAFLGFERPHGFSLANPEASHNYIGRLSRAQEAFAQHATEFAGKFDSTLGGMTEAMGQTVNSFGGQFGGALQNLLSAFGQQTGGGGGTFGFIRWLVGTGRGGLFDQGGVITANSGFPVGPSHRAVIGMIGERMIPPGQNAGGASPVFIRINNATGVPIEEPDAKVGPDGEINIDLITRQVEKNIETKFGLRRPVGRR